MVNDASRRRHDSKDELRGPRISARSSDPGLCGNDFRFFRPEATLSTDFVGQQFQIVTHFQSINANPKPDVPRQSVGSDSHIQARTDQFVLTGRVD